MKNIKILFFFTLIISILILSGCNLIKNDIQKVEQLLLKYEQITDVDMNYTISINTSDVNFSVDSHAIIKNVGENQQVFMEITEGTETVRMYYIDGYICTIANNEYIVADLKDFDLSSANPFPSDFKFDFNKLKYKLTTLEKDNDVTYTITIEDADIKSMVEELLGQEIENLDIGLTLELVADKETELLKVLRMALLINQESVLTKIDINVTINKIGNEVELKVPEIVTRKIEDYIKNSNSKPDQDPDPDLDPVTYKDTVDGIVKYFDIGLYRNIVYDKTTNRIAVMRNNTIDIYNADTMSLEKQITSLLTPYTFDADKGRLVVCYGTNSFRVYDLNTFEFNTIQTSIDVYEIVINGETVIYADEDQWCTIVFHNLITNSKTNVSRLYRPKLTLNRKDNILYVTETDSSSSDLIYFDAFNGQKLYESESSSFLYVKDRIRFDGMYIHHYGKTFNRFQGYVVSSSYLNRLYSFYPEFQPSETLYESNKLSFVRSVKLQNKVAIYDNHKDKFVYNFSFDCDSIIQIRDGKYLGTTKSGNYVAVIDVNIIDTNIVDEEEVVYEDGTIVTSDDQKLKTLHISNFTKSITDTNYIYTLNEYSNELNVFDGNTLKKVFSKRFLLDPKSIDANDGKLVIGFGEAKQFWIFDSNTWQYNVVITEEPVYSTLIYKNTIIYSDINQHCKVHVYNIETKTHSVFGYYGYFITMAINREDEVVYFGDMRSSGCDLTYYNLKSNQIIFRSDVSYSRSGVSFDGNFVHYNNSIYDKTGVVISKTEVAREYKGFGNTTSVKTIFDNDSISIFSGLRNNEYITIIYELSTNSILYTIKGKGSTASLINGKIIVFNTDGKIMQISLK